MYSFKIRFLLLVAVVILLITFHKLHFKKYFSMYYNKFDIVIIKFIEFMDEKWTDSLYLHLIEQNYDLRLSKILKLNTQMSL